MAQYRSGLEEAILKALDKRDKNGSLRRLNVKASTAIDFSSNDFLSLATSDSLRRDFLKELEHEQLALGSGGSRLLDGNSAYAERLEGDIATFHHAEAGLLCNSGYDANASIFSTLPQPGDVVLYDEFIHASVHDGMRLSRAARWTPFAHNDAAALERLLKALLEDARFQHGRQNVFVAVETVYSMDGDVAPLGRIVQLAKSLFPQGNCHLVVDEAHSTGVFGPQGRGLVSQLGLEKDFSVRLHTFGKALACNGAIILCSPLIRKYLINYARPLIYTTFMSYPALAAIRSSYSLLICRKTEPLARHLWMLIDAFHSRLQTLRADLDALLTKSSNLLRISTEPPKSPIFNIMSSDPKALASYCRDNGVVVYGITTPTVPIGAERVRCCLHAGNSVEELDRLVKCFRDWMFQRLRAEPVRSNAKL